jgi:hypothetical protein
LVSSKIEPLTALSHHYSTVTGVVNIPENLFTIFGISCTLTNIVTKVGQKKAAQPEGCTALLRYKNVGFSCEVGLFGNRFQDLKYPWQVHKFVSSSVRTQLCSGKAL